MPLAPDELLRCVRLNAALDLVVADADRRAALERVLEGAAALAGEGARAVVQGLPRVVGEAMRERGWAWNGIYVLREDGKLHLASAFGPPVCSELERSGGVLTSGMCFDGLELNQTLAAHDAKAWPGYVSCDAESGLGTVAGIVSPLRDPRGAPVAVWDLDATTALEPGDVRFVDVLLATLSRAVAFESAAFRAD